MCGRTRRQDLQPPPRRNTAAGNVPEGAPRHGSAPCSCPFRHNESAAMFRGWGNGAGVVGVLAAAFAAAESAADPYVAFLHTILPPPEYDKPYGGKLTKRFLPVAELYKECGGPGKSGCARPAGDTCEIFVAE